MIGREKRVLLRHYLEQGTPKAEIARQLEISRRTVYNWIEAGELDRGARPVPAAGLPTSLQARYTCRIMSAARTSLPGAVFFDLYGTVAREVGYINHPDRFRLHDFSAEAIRLLNYAGWRVFVATNQSGITRGYFTEDVLNEVRRRLVEPDLICDDLPAAARAIVAALPQEPEVTRTWTPTTG